MLISISCVIQALEIYIELNIKLVLEFITATSSLKTVIPVKSAKIKAKMGLMKLLASVYTGQHVKS